MELTELRRTWDKLGRDDPMWAVLTCPWYKGGGWDPDEFFRRGRVEVDDLLRRAQAHGLEPKKGSALDFGCGVGRLTQALAAHFASVVGVDIAESMVAEAERYNRHPGRCRYVVNDEADLGQFREGTFDLVLSSLVLQHMEPRFAQGYVSEFVRVLAPGGVAVFEVPSQFHTELQPSLSHLRLDARAYRAALSCGITRLTVLPRARFTVPVTVRNAGAEPWPASREDLVIGLGNHWRRRWGTMLQHDDGRSYLSHDLGAGESVELGLQVTAPAAPGSYVLELDMVHEAETWFAHRGSSTLRIPVKVEGRRRLGAARPEPSAAEPAPVMEMHAVPEERIIELVASAGGRVVAVERADVPRMTDCTYFVVKG